MKTIISPAKNMNVIKDIEMPIDFENLDENTIKLCNIMKNLSPDDFSVYMKINSELALKTFTYYQDMDLSKMGTPAICSYNGIQYKNINPLDFDEKDIAFSNEHINIISGFYGLLKSQTPIQPYRLEMGLKMPFNFKTLYKLWGDTIYYELYSDTDTVINLASDEYSKAITPFLKENDRFITVKFLKYSKGKYKALATDSKISRGQMVRFIVKNKIDNPEKLKSFDGNDYTFSEHLSDSKTFVFTKDM